MDIITEMAHEIQQLKFRLANMVRAVNVAKIHPAEALVDVAIDAELVIERIPFLTRRAGEDKTYWMPSVGEQGYLLSPSGELDNAAFLPAIFSDKIPAPRDHEKWTTREWADGTTETYDKDAHEYVLQLSGDTHRKVNREELQDKRGATEMNMDGTEAELKNAQGHFKVNGSQAEMNYRDGTKVTQITLDGTEAKMENLQGNFKVNAGEAKIVFGATEITLNASGITLSFGASRIVLNATGVIFTGLKVENTTPLLSWNGTPTTPIAWVAVT